MTRTLFRSSCRVRPDDVLCRSGPFSHPSLLPKLGSSTGRAPTVTPLTCTISGSRRHLRPQLRGPPGLPRPGRTVVRFPFSRTTTPRPTPEPPGPVPVPTPGLPRMGIKSLYPPTRITPKVCTRKYQRTPHLLRPAPPRTHSRLHHVGSSGTRSGATPPGTSVELDK